MQRDDNFDLSIFHREEDEPSIEEKSSEIADEEIENLPDIEVPTSTPSRRTRKPVAVVRPSARTPPRSPFAEIPSRSVRRARSTMQPSPATLQAAATRIIPSSSSILQTATARMAPPSSILQTVASRMAASPSLTLETSATRTPPSSIPRIAATRTSSSAVHAAVRTPSASPGRPSTSVVCTAVHTGPCTPQRRAPRGITESSQITTPLSAQPSTSKGTGRKRKKSITIYDASPDSVFKKSKFDPNISDDSDTESDSDLEEDSLTDLASLPDTEPEVNSDEDVDRTRNNDIMPFPRQGEDLNFDVSTLSHLPGQGFTCASMGDKRYAEFLRAKALTTECIEELYNSLKESLNEQTEVPDPRGLTVQLMPHQKQALKWMQWREKKKPSGGILADDMGLGKTLQMISLVLAEKNEKRLQGEEDDDDSDEDSWDVKASNKIYDGKTLVVCLASLTRQWEKEIKTKCRNGQLRVYVYHGPSRQISEAKLAKYDIVITTYNLVMKEYELDVAPKKNKDSRLFKIHWQRVILDEAHFIRNFKSKISKAACELRANSRWALTGTPIQNKEADFYALLKFLKCSPFDEWRVWTQWVSNRSSAGNQRLIVITKSLMLRRTKAELMEQNLIQKLPEKQTTMIEIRLDQGEKIAYQKLLLYSQTFFQEFLRQKKDKEHLKEFGCHMRPSLIAQEVPVKMSRMLRLLMKHHKDIGTHYILVLILRLRQICCHPALINAMLDQEILQVEGIDKQTLSPNLITELNKMLEDDDDDDEEDGFDFNASMAKRVMSRANPVFSDTRKSSKVKQILKVVDSILDKGEKVIIVSQWTGFLKVIERHLHTVDGARFATFSGGVHVRERQLILDRVNDPNDCLNVLLLSLTAGGQGLNLVGANHLLLVDLHWNPQLETQAQDRIYRFGQENNVHIYKFICVETIEEKIKALQDKKLEIAKLVLTGRVRNTLTIEDLKLLFS